MIFLRHMDAELYRAAELGNWDAIQKFASQIYRQRTTGGNTVLHVVAQFCDSSDAVQQILARAPGLLYRRNAKSETALHISARKGHLNVVEALLSFAKGHESRLASDDARCCAMLSATNKEGNTALHEAVRYNFPHVVELLVEKSLPFSHPTKSLNICVRRILFMEDRVPSFRYRANSAGESPLYLALENDNYGIAAKILSNFNSPSFDGPGKRTALHAAALGKFPECTEVLELILEKLPQLTKKVDKYGWTALHYAAKFNNQEVARLLLIKDKSMAYISPRKNGKKAALHVAVIHGHVVVMREILSHCPDCWEMITYAGRNMLHLAVKNEQKEVLDFILQNSWAADLVNQRDVGGNTPLHLYAAKKELDGHNLVNYPCVNRNATNHAGLTPLDKIKQSDEVTDRQNAIKDELEQADATHQQISKSFIIKKIAKVSKDEAEIFEKSSGVHMIVATLMITVTFAAGFTIPGGYNGGGGANEGMEVIGKKAALAAFVISDSFAMMLSVSVVLHLFLIRYNPLFRNDLLHLLSNRLLIICAMTSMIVAFVSGLFAVLPVLGIKIYLCVITVLLCFSVPLYAVGTIRAINLRARLDV